MTDARISNSMLAVADVFDIDQHTGFMAPNPPLHRLPQYWEAWEIILDTAVDSKLQIADKLGVSEEDRAISRQWRETVRAVRATLFNSHIFLIPHSYPRYPLLVC